MGPAQGRPTRLRRQYEVRALVPPPSQELIDEYRRNGTIIRLLLLGAGESGKSTVLKQMRILHGVGFSEEYRRDIKPLISYNVIEGAEAILHAMDGLGHPITDPEMKAQADIIQHAYSQSENHQTTLSEEVVRAILTLLDYEPFKETLRQGAKFQIQDGWLEFAKQLRHFPEWGGPTWIPKQEDILLSRVRTSGVLQSEYFVLNDHMFEMIDVGGQKPERKKWVTAFKGIHAMVFVASISDYDQVLYEDYNVNRLQDSITLWTKMANNDNFKDSAIILFLNKFDLFCQKYYYQGVPIINPLPNEVPNPPKREEEVDEACKLALTWFKDIFKKRVKGPKQHTLNIHVTTAINPITMDQVIHDCTKFILYRVLGQAGLIGF